MDKMEQHMNHYFFSACQRIVEAYIRNAGQEGNIMVFHQVDDNLNHWKEANCSITVKSFKRCIEMLNENKYGIHSICNIVERDYCGNYITFDDGYMDTYEIAYPILQKIRVPFTVFVTTSYLNTAGFLTKAALREMAENPLCTIGAHTVSHPMIRKLSTEMIREEIVNCRIELEDTIGKPIDFFAYPYGSIYACGIGANDIVRSVGFNLAFSTLNAPLNTLSKKFMYFLPRRNINEKNYRECCIK